MEKIGDDNQVGGTATAKVENQRRAWQLQKVCRGSQLEKRLACWRRQAHQAAGALEWAKQVLDGGIRVPNRKF